MKYPHHKYITYLLSRKLTAFELRADCAAKRLLVPSDEYLLDAGKLLGSPPKCWRAKVTRQNVTLRRWLRDAGVAKLWTRDKTTTAAIEMLYKSEIRKDFEAILLTHGDISQARRELSIKYPEHLIPSDAALTRYCMFFWDIGSMESGEIYAHIEESSGKEDYLPAVQGDLVDAYARLGLQQRITHESLLSVMAEAGYAMAVRVRKEQATISPKDAVSLMTAATLGVAASRELGETRRQIGGDGSIKRDAEDFMVRVTSMPRIPSIDEIGRQVILDADYTEEGESNVRRFSAIGE